MPTWSRRRLPRPTRAASLILTSGLALALSLQLGSATASMPTGADAAVTHEPAATHAKKVVVKVDPRLFGVHDYYWNSLHRKGTGAIRLWDSDTMWDNLFPTQGNPDWSRLDEAVKLAHADHTEVTLVLGLTPTYAAADPSSPTYATSMPNLAMYKAYVTAVMQRYRNFDGYQGIANYQVWNEANITTFWTGGYAGLAQLTKTVYDVRNAVDPKAKVIAPAMVTRLGYQQAGLRQFYATKVGGKPVWKYVDAISLNLYPLDVYGKRPGTPETSMQLLAQSKQQLRRDHVPASIPIWNTEVNYGMHTGALGGHAATPIPAARQVAYLMRTFLLNAAAGIKRVDWYAYDMGDLPPAFGGKPLGNTLLTNPADRPGGQLLPAGYAFTRIQQWMKGSLIGVGGKRPCAADKHGTYTCVVKYRHGMGRIYWNPFNTAKVRLVPSAKKKVDELGKASKAKGRSKLKVDYRPVLVLSKH